MEMYKDIQTGLAKKQSDLESNFATKYKNFEKNVNDMQKRLADPTEIVTQIQKEQIDQQLTKQRMDLENLQNSYMSQLQQEGITANRMIIEYIMAYLKNYTKGKGIQYILSYGFGGNILYTDSTLDITNEILFGLNEKYLKEKSLKK
jgi:Skp family chaperone for outer membrane proteins